MAVYENATAAASATVGTDLLASQSWRTSSRPRILERIAVAGSAASGDSAVEVVVNQVSIGYIYTSGTGAPQWDRDYKECGFPIGANSVVTAIVRDAPATNALHLGLKFRML
jgi:hypothetical protein